MAGFVATEQKFRCLSVYKDLWILAAALGRKESENEERQEENQELAA